MRTFRTILCIAALFFAGWWLGRRSVDIRTEIHVDTVFYERPKPFHVSDQTISVNVPKWLFARDTVYETVVVSETDSVQVEVPVRTLEYRDSTYYARVVGPVVGSLAPRLDWIETYDRTITRTVTKPNRFAVTVGAGVGYTPQGFQPTIGMGVGVILWQW